MEYFFKIAAIGFIEFILIYLYTKNGNTYRKRKEIRKAISRYNDKVYSDRFYLRTYDFPEYIDYGCMKPYPYTLFVRFWDWGNEHIVPREVYEKIEPYL